MSLFKKIKKPGVFRTGSVYSGPEPTNNIKIQPEEDLKKSLSKYPSQDEDTYMDEVYAGPEFWEDNKAQGEEPSQNHDAEIMLLYAAPEVLRDEPVIAAVYAGPVPPLKGLNNIKAEQTKGVSKEPKIFCQNCGCANKISSKFCVECGTKFPGEWVDV